MEENCGIKCEAADDELVKGTKSSLNNTLRKLKSSLKMSIFARCFPSLDKNHHSSLEAIRISLLDPLIKTLSSELSSIINEELAVPLKDLSSLLKNRRATRQDLVTWRPSGLPENDLIVHDSKVLLYEKQKLLATLAIHRNNRLQLYHRVKTGRKVCHNNHLKLEEHLSKLDELENAIEAIPVCEMTSKLTKMLEAAD